MVIDSKVGSRSLRALSVQYQWQLEYSVNFLDLLVAVLLCLAIESNIVGSRLAAIMHVLSVICNGTESRVTEEWGQRPAGYMV